MPEGCALAFDFGERRIGVAVGESLVGIAHPLCTIDSEITDERFTRIAALIDEWRPQSLVVGLPTHADGTEHEMTRLSRRFANRLKGRFALPVWLVDERHTSLLAESLLSEAGLKGRKQKPVLDQVAAQAILQTWFDMSGESV
ncbi:Holliday junction resolvase RuvX [Paludibacterium purpuratum]|uniref:Putative pre-16S rRNA nuclease n=1 Tax=Paludibacterium purpuratum TaxID=1144873 RepID=A0A4R7B695_9NEIS|nr:Holliday junction resolvase RuvX [Paludibacterium purpuratum]TDR78480.1 putative Holliday junction resolvase [Paludibacterium purpuratum]